MVSLRSKFYSEVKITKREEFMNNVVYFDFAKQIPQTPPLEVPSNPGPVQNPVPERSLFFSDMDLN